MTEQNTREIMREKLNMQVDLIKMLTETNLNLSRALTGQEHGHFNTEIAQLSNKFEAANTRAETLTERVGELVDERDMLKHQVESFARRVQDIRRLNEPAEGEQPSVVWHVLDGLLNELER